MRDRLIELLRTKEEDYTITCPHYSAEASLETCTGCQYDMEDGGCDYVAREADYFLENGVIVAPCKVGDTVYQICFGKLSEQKIIKKSKVTAVKITDKLTITLDYVTNLYDTDIGYWLFVGKNAKEEAEKALKGGVE